MYRAIAMRVKGLLALISAIVADVTIYFEDDVVTGHEWYLIVLVTLSAVGVYVFPNKVDGQNVITSAKAIGYYNKTTIRNPTDR